NPVSAGRLTSRAAGGHNQKLCFIIQIQLHPYCSDAFPSEAPCCYQQASPHSRLVKRAAGTLQKLAVQVKMFLPAGFRAAGGQKFKIIQCGRIKAGKLFSRFVPLLTLLSRHSFVVGRQSKDRSGPLV
ncbi:hypothetical protein XENOCAPTIV_002150, partial [Xenoophorus captivus]